MARSFRLPDLGEGIHEAEVLAVHVSAGKQVKEGDIILEVETDKAAVEIPSPFSGTISKVHVRVGGVIKVGDALIDVDKQDVSLAKVKSGTDQKEDVPLAEGHKNNVPVPASPATRRLARQLGLDLRRVPPTGRGGVVTAEDVRAFARAEEKSNVVKTSPEEALTEKRSDRPVGSVLPDFTKWGALERIPFRSIRRATARRMATAWSQIPHVNSQDTVDITRLEAFRQKHKADVKAAGGRLTLTVFMLKAVVTALKTYPQFNASLDVESQEIIIKQYYHIGVAVNTDDGLMVPVIRDVDRKSIKELTVELNDCIQRVRARKISREELQGGTFTITNAGAMGGGFFTPIINYPEVAILGMGQGRMQPAVITGKDGSQQIEPRLIMPIVLCIDHRVLDGADAIRFLKVVTNALQDPDELLMTMI